MPEESPTDSAPPAFPPPARFTRWWADFAAACGADNPTIKAIEKVGRTGWSFASVLAALPMLLFALLALPLMRAAARAQREGRSDTIAQWLFVRPAIALLWIGHFLGWTFVVLIFVRFLTDAGLQKDVADTVKFFAGVAVVQGTFPLINEVQFRLWNRFNSWRMSDRISWRLASFLSYIIWFALVGMLVYFGIVTAAP